ncbi:hypothetical protein [Candidatus Nitrotoga sp. 1052]|nr:hypothetical protein [Candidatus Nitrotoga sp. 1052]
MVAVLDAPASERSLIGERLDQDELAQDVPALVVASWTRSGGTTVG